jgi:hypothetical protein
LGSLNVSGGTTAVFHLRWTTSVCAGAVADRSLQLVSGRGDSLTFDGLAITPRLFDRHLVAATWTFSSL